MSGPTTPTNQVGIFNTAAEVEATCKRSASFSPGRKPPSFATPQNQLVTVDVIDNGGEKTKFVVHKAFLTYYSPFFNVAFNGRFSESATQSMEFYDCSPKIFGMMLHYVYTQKVESTQGSDPPADDLILLWLLADKLLMPKLQNITIHALEEKCAAKADFYPKTFKAVYESTLGGSPLRKFLADYFASSISIELGEAAEYPPEMLADMFLAARQLITRKGGRFSAQKMKRYLVNEEEKAR